MYFVKAVCYVFCAYLLKPLNSCRCFLETHKTEKCRIFDCILFTVAFSRGEPSRRCLRLPTGRSRGRGRLGLRRDEPNGSCLLRLPGDEPSGCCGIPRGQPSGWGCLELPAGQPSGVTSYHRRRGMYCVKAICYVFCAYLLKT